MQYTAPVTVKDEIPAILAQLAQRIRERRIALAFTIRELSEKSGLSPRFVASVEAGRGNISVLRLERVARALGTSAATLLGGEESAQHAEVNEQLVALVGIRGAGKSSLGNRAAGRLDVPFIEMDELIAERAGMSLEEIFSLHGADYYRRCEARELDRLLSSGQRGIVAMTGSIVTQHATYAKLRAHCVTVFLRATAEEHHNRVAAQGEMHGAGDHRDALADLRALVRARRALYEQADHTIDTSSLGLERSVDALVRIARRVLVSPA